MSAIGNLWPPCRFVPAFLLSLTLVSSAARAAAPCQVAELAPFDNPPQGNGFGESVSISGDYLVMGAWLDGDIDDQAGAAYVFQQIDREWVGQSKLFGSDIGFHSTFGMAVDMDGDRIVVGAPHFDPSGGQPGQAYVFERTGGSWIQTARLIPSESSFNDRFGQAVAIDGDTIVVGALLGGPVSGRAFIFRWNGSNWIEEAALSGDIKAEFTNYAERVTVAGDVVGITSRWDAGNSGPGAVYVYRRNAGSWPLDAKLTADAPHEFDGFGSSATAYGNLLLVGVTGDSAQAQNAGAVYVYEYGGGMWNHTSTIYGSQPDQTAGVGRAIAFDGLHVVVTDLANAGHVIKKLDNGWSSATPLGLGFVPGVSDTYAALNRRIFALDPVPPCIPATSDWTVILLLLLVSVAATVHLRKMRSCCSLVCLLAIISSHLHRSQPIRLTARTIRSA